jgi:signal transduction histidine kinase
MLGHEFKTPLTVIAGNAELLDLELAHAQGLDPAGMHESTQAIRDEARRLTRLLDDLLLLDRIDAHRLVLRLQLVDINALAAETIERMRAVEPERSFIESPRVVPAQIQGDGERLRHVIVNLLSNAMKFSRPHDAIAVSTWIEGDGLWLSVSDGGIGIAEEEIPYIFDRYSRAGSGVQRGISGSGLGLSIVKEIARLHGGRVRAESELGNGTTVSVWLPFTHSSDNEAPLLP